MVQLGNGEIASLAAAEPCDRLAGVAAGNPHTALVPSHCHTRHRPSQRCPRRLEEHVGRFLAQCDSARDLLTHGGGELLERHIAGCHAIKKQGPSGLDVRGRRRHPTRCGPVGRAEIDGHDRPRVPPRLLEHATEDAGVGVVHAEAVESRRLRHQAVSTGDAHGVGARLRSAPR